MRKVLKPQQAKRNNEAHKILSKHFAQSHAHPKEQTLSTRPQLEHF